MSVLAQALEPFMNAHLRASLCEAVRSGELERNHRTRPGYPANFPGMAAYAERCRHLTEVLAPQGWTRSDPDQQVVLTSPCGGFRLVTMAGDENTGRLWAPGPRTRPKGPCTRAAVRQNGKGVERLVQMSLPFASTDDNEENTGLTLFLLVYRDHGAGRVRAELAVAIAIREKVASAEYDYEYRELLLDESVGDVPLAQPKGDEGPTTIDFDVLPL